MQDLNLARKDRTNLLGAQRDDLCDALSWNLCDRLRAVMGNVDSNLGEDSNCEGVKLARIGPCAVYADGTGRHVARQSLGELAARRIRNAEKEQVGALLLGRWHGLALLKETLEERAAR